jgi:hypothetical protein
MRKALFGGINDLVAHGVLAHGVAFSPGLLFFFLTGNVGGFCK